MKKGDPIAIPMAIPKHPTSINKLYHAEIGSLIVKSFHYPLRKNSLCKNNRSR